MSGILAAGKVTLCFILCHPSAFPFLQSIVQLQETFSSHEKLDTVRKAEYFRLDVDVSLAFLQVPDESVHADKVLNNICNSSSVAKILSSSVSFIQEPQWLQGA